MHTPRTVIVLFGLLASIAQPAMSQSRSIKITSYDIDAVIAPHAHAIEITAICTVQKTDTSLQTQVLLSSTSRLQTVQALVKGSRFDLPFQFVGKDTLDFQFPATMRHAGKLALKFVYTFPIDSLGNNMLLLDRGSRWYPLIADQIAELRLKCEVPKGYTVLSAGDFLERKESGLSSQFIWRSRLPIFKLPLVVFKSSTLKRNSSQVLGKEVVLYSSATDTFSVDPVLAESNNAFKFFTDAIGKYPYDCLTLVEVPYFEGIDVSSGLLMVGSSSLKGMRSGYFDPLLLTVAQQWMGVGVFAQFRQRGFWFLTISLPHYLRLMYVRHSKGEAAFDEALHEPLKRYQQFAGKENDVPILDVDFPNSREKGLVLYGKGPYVISKLHRQFGDERWKAFLQDLYKGFLGKILTYDDFMSCVSRHDRNGEGLALMNMLTTQKGMPRE